MMKKEIKQSEGINQIALINSKDNDITIINNPNEYISSLIRKGKLEEAVDVFAEVYNQFEKLHPLYPNYIYKPVELGSKIVFKHHPASKEIAEQLPLHYKGKFSIKDKDLRKDETLGDFITRKYLSQEKISVDIKYIETWIGEHLIDNPFSFENQLVDNAEWFILPDKLPPPIKSKLVLSDDRVDRTVIDYLELRVTEVNNNENRIIISNKHQVSSPIVLALTIPNILSDKTVIEGSSKFDIKIRQGFEGRVIAEKLFLQFIKYAGQSTKISFIELEEQKEFFSAEDMNLDDPQDPEVIEERISILNDLLQIEDALEVEFQLPDIIEREDFEKIFILKRIIEDKEVIASIDSFSAVFDNIEALRKMIYVLKNQPVTVTAKEKMVIELFGIKFENIGVSHTFDNLIIKDPERIKKKLEFLDIGDTVNVEFEPGTKNIVSTRYNIISN